MADDNAPSKPAARAADTARPARQSDALTRLFQGRPLGHPLHPMLVHLPIGLWLLSFALDIISLTRANAASGFAFNRASFYALLAGLAFAVLAMITGLADYSDIRRDHPARRTATWHMALNLTAFVVYAASAVMRYLFGFYIPAPPLAAFVLSCVGVALISVSGYLGGVMVYADGVGVGRHRRRHEVRQTKHVDAPPDDGYVPVLDAADLPDDTPTRAEVNGHAVVLLRLRGELHAFQEFCTHRYGPLSEGQLDGANIMCPWHRSCFEVRTGKVVNGPAKVDLKTYPVREEVGQIWVGGISG